MSDSLADVAEFLDEVFADLASGDTLTLVSLEPAQVDAWVSNLLAAWRTELAVADPTVIDRELVARCVAAQSIDALLICKAVELLAPATAEAAAAAIVALIEAGVSQPLVAGTNDSTGESGVVSEATGAWLIEPAAGAGRGRDVAIVVGFTHPDGSEHVLLADLSGGEGGERLVGLRLDGPAADVIPVEDDNVDLDLDLGRMPLGAAPIEPRGALQRIAAAWEASTETTPDFDRSSLELMLVNQLVAGARLRAGLGVEAPAFLDEIDIRPLLGASTVAAEAVVEPIDPEAVRANAVSLRTFRAALRSYDVVPAPEVMVDVVASLIAGPVPGLIHDEAEAVRFLEWADWLGVLIGLVRGGPEVAATPSSLVDLVNRCPEVSSAIPKADRGYIEFAFSVVLDLWGQAGVVSDDRLTEDGHRSLYPAVVKAWGS